MFLKNFILKFFLNMLNRIQKPEEIIMTEKVAALQTIINKVIEFLVAYSFRIVGAIIILILGIWIAKSISKIINSLLTKKKIDTTLSSFVANCVKLLVIVFAVIIALGKFGITIAPFIAAIGAGAFGLTYAIQGPLSNYGAGIAIIIGRPFKIGDAIKVRGVTGIVEDIKLGSTVLKDEDGVIITIPNKHIVGEILYNSDKFKIVEDSIGISYDSSPEKAIEIIKNVLYSNKKVTDHPAPQIGISEFGDSSINIEYRYWVPTMDYFSVKYNVNLEIFNKFKENNITIPFPQMEVKIKEKEN